MSGRFRTWLDPDPERLSRLSALETGNPLLTPGYAEARRRIGERVVLLVLEHGDTWSTGALGFLRGRGGGLLEIPCSPGVPADSPFWSGLADFVRAQRVRAVELASFASTSVDLPQWPDRVRTTQRTEWVLDLAQGAGAVDLSSGHRRNARKAAAAGVEMVVRSGAEGLEAHLGCFESSMDRRAQRGETVPSDLGDELLRGWLETGAAELVQAVRDGQVLSSILALRSPAGAYYQSSGTTEEGRALGASPFLVAAFAERLAGDGVTRFNLGGAHDDNPGLQRFKRGFGARAVPLESARFSTASGGLHKLWELGRRARAAFRARRAGR